MLSRQTTADGTLTLRAHRTQERDGALVSLGFEQSAWHMHPSADEALDIVDAVLADRVVIIQRRVMGEPYVELMSDLEQAFDLAGPDATYRIWSGPVTLEDLVEERVPYTPLDELWNWRVDPKHG